MSVLSANKLVVDIPGKADGMPLDITINPGEIWGVLGPNGAGKTTLLHTLAGLRPPRYGQVLLDGKALGRWQRKALAQKLAVIFQERQDGFPGTVLETAMIGRHPFLSHWELDTADDVAIAKKALAAMELDHMSQRLVNTLSGGERQRLVIATALIQTPQILLADEPSNHLDLRHQVHIMRLIREQAEAGCGVLLCLHDLNIAARCCDKLLLLYPNGEACWGDAATMLVPTALEKLYDQALMAVEVNGHRFFLPRENHG